MILNFISKDLLSVKSFSLYGYEFINWNWYALYLLFVREYLLIPLNTFSFQKSLINIETIISLNYYTFAKIV